RGRGASLGFRDPPFAFASRAFGFLPPPPDGQDASASALTSLVVPEWPRKATSKTNGGGLQGSRPTMLRPPSPPAKVRLKSLIGMSGRLSKVTWARPPVPPRSPLRRSASPP